MKKKYKLIIFDLDGVLVNTEEFYLNSVIKAFKHFGYEFDMEYCKKHFAGVAIPLVISRFNENNKNIKKIDYDAFTKILTKCFDDEFTNHVTIVKGAKELIKQLSIPYCIASASSLHNIVISLKSVGLIEFFNKKNIFSCHMYKKYKPDPEVYLQAAKNMGFNTKDCLAIEDSSVGVQAAKAAGIDVIGFLGADYLQTYKDKHKTLLFNSGCFISKDCHADVFQFITENT